VDEKEQIIEQLRRDIKLSKAVEVEIELNQYIEECKRLRQMLELNYFDSNSQQ